MSSLEKNIPKLYWIKALRWFMLMMPIIVLFFQENGLSMSEVMLLQALFAISVVIFEVPSGYLADVIGRKKSIVWGCIIGTLGFSVYSFSYGFYGFLIAEVLMGLGSSFISGADSALIYESLVAQKKEKNYKKIEGRYQAIGNISEAAAGIIGGLLALISLRTPIYVEALFTIPAIFIALSLVEPKRIEKQVKENVFKNLMSIVKFSLHDHKEIKWLIFYGGFITAGGISSAWFIQPWLQTNGLPPGWFGLVWAALMGSAAWFAIKSDAFEKRFGRKNSLIAIPFLGLIGYVAMGFFTTLWAIGFLFLFQAARGLSNPVLKDYVNVLVPPHMRATVLSIKNLIGRLAFSIIAPILGYISDTFSMNTALYTAGITFFTLSMISVLFLKLYKKL